jgi:hypothetical protein
LAFGLCAGVGVQAWRNFPADGPATMGPAMLVFVVAVLAAFLGGYRMGRPFRVSASATAVAVASADAAASSQSTVNVAVFAPGQGAGSVAPGVAYPSDAAPWLGPARERLSLDDLDGMEVAELIEATEYEPG